MKPIFNPVIELIVTRTASGYDCNYSYKALKEAVSSGSPISGCYIEKTTGTGRTGAGVSPIIGVALQTFNQKIGIRYYAITFNASTGVASGSASTLYMASDGTISTTA